MPKGFTEREKEIIRNKLLEKGKEFLSIYGIRKTNVEDLTKAAGISKGAFYVFYESKEELFFEIFEQFEKEMKEYMFTQVFKNGEVTKDSLRNLVKGTLEVLAANPLMKSFNKEELEYLVRKLPPEKLEAHKSNDDDFASELYKMLSEKNKMKECDPVVLSGLFRGFAYLSFHKDGIGEEVYPKVADLIADMVSSYFIEE